jgi:hypothetical protein
MKRGQFKASERFLSRAWNWGKTSVHRFIADLERESMIMWVDREADREADRFSICNYELYNDVGTTSRTTSRTKYKESFKESINKTTTHAAGAAVVDPLSSTESLRLSELLRSAIALRDPLAKAAKLPVKTGWARDIEKLMHVDGRRVEDIEVVIAWCQKDGCFWAPNVLSGRKLREKFDTMYGQMKRENNRNSSAYLGAPPEDLPDQTLEEFLSCQDDPPWNSHVWNYIEIKFGGEAADSLRLKMGVSVPEAARRRA